MATVVRAVFAGWLIASVVWPLPSARSARLVTILLITYVVAMSKLSHVIAGSVEARYSVMAGAASVQDYLLNFLRQPYSAYDRWDFTGGDHKPWFHRGGDD
jgi:formate/nitrite transporter FocA (FNT family)